MTVRAVEPQFNVAPNYGRPGLVSIAVGTAMEPHSITPETAEALADDLLAAAAAARKASGG